MIGQLFWVGLGGALGSTARFLCQRWLGTQFPGNFPVGTFSVNLAGCFLIGLFWGWSLRNGSVTNNWNLFLMTGLCGGFTTFSAFTLEGIGLLKSDKIFLFVLYIVGSVAAGLLATYSGIRLARI